MHQATVLEAGDSIRIGCIDHTGMYHEVTIEAGKAEIVVTPTAGWAEPHACGWKPNPILGVAERIEF